MFAIFGLPVVIFCTAYGVGYAMGFRKGYREMRGLIEGSNESSMASELPKAVAIQIGPD